MRLSKIPYSDFHEYITQRLSPILGDNASIVADDILSHTGQHPYYTQQLASEVWELATYEHIVVGVVEEAIIRLTHSHDLDFERLWINFNRIDKRVMLNLSCGQNPLQNRQVPTSTSYSSIKRLVQKGFLIQTDHYEIEDPFFRRWIQDKVN